MTDINLWNETDDANNAAAPAGWPEGMMPSGVNNAARAMMGSLKRWRDQSGPFAIATGIGNAQIINYAVAPTSLVMGDVFSFYSVNTNNTPATLQINGLGPYAIMNSQGLPLIGGELTVGAVITVGWDGFQFRMLTAPTPLSVSNGGTGSTTAAGAADAIGAVHIAGDTMTGPLTVPSLTATGNMNVIGLLTAQNITVSGNEVVSGNETVNGLLTAQNLNVAGNEVVTGNLTTNQTLTATNINVAQNVAVTGAVNVGANLSVVGTTYTHNVYPYSDNAASVGVPGYAYSGMASYGFTTVSDQSVKGDIQPLPPGSLDLVQTIMPHTYIMTTGPDQTTRHAGFIAQEVDQALQSTGHVAGYVLDKESGIAGLVYAEMVAVLWGAVRELTARLKQVEER